MRAFESRTSLNVIMIPPAVKVINDGAFMCCVQLTTENLCEGLEEIGKQAL